MQSEERLILNYKCVRYSSIQFPCCWNIGFIFLNSKLSIKSNKHGNMINESYFYHDVVVLSIIRKNTKHFVWCSFYSSCIVSLGTFLFIFVRSFI